MRLHDRSSCVFCNLHHVVIQAKISIIRQLNHEPQNSLKLLIFSSRNRKFNSLGRPNDPSLTAFYLEEVADLQPRIDPGCTDTHDSYPEAVAYAVGSLDYVSFQAREVPAAAGAQHGAEETQALQAIKAAAPAFDCLNAPHHPSPPSSLFRRIVVQRRDTCTIIILP
jgi:hypothetical protein